MKTGIAVKQYHCKKCYNAYRREWYKLNKDKVGNYGRAYRESHHEHDLECRRKYRTQNKEKIQSKRRDDYRNNKQKYKGYKKTQTIRIKKRRRKEKIELIRKDPLVLIMKPFFRL